jgi:hypothetical protein
MAVIHFFPNRWKIFRFFGFLTIQFLFGVDRAGLKTDTKKGKCSIIFPFSALPTDKWPGHRLAGSDLAMGEAEKNFL